MDTVFQIDSLDIFQKVSQDLTTSLYYIEKGTNTQLLESDAFEKAKHDLRTIISECDFDIQKILLSFQNKEWNREKVEYFFELLERNWSEILSATLNFYNSSYGETVTNFDWLVKLVLGTSELKTMKYPLLQLILASVNKIGQQNKVMYDMNKDMLLKFITALENIKV